MGKIILVTGTSSGAGKSTIVTALCRILSDMGYRVAPFKASNMSRNSVSLDDGSEIARAQWLQAVAARVSPSKEMNPVLLKPEGNRASQVILDGRSCGVMDIAAYREFLATKARDVVGRSLRKLAESYQVVVAEGAGSPAEINITDYDLANTFVLENFNPVTILVADIDRGGAFASILGTLSLMRNPSSVRGIIINRMQGDASMLGPGISAIENRTGTMFLGVVPMFHGLAIPGEDSLDYHRERLTGSRICVIKTPYMENYSDVDPLVSFGIGFTFVDGGNSDILRCCELIVLPGSKNVFLDLEYLRETGLERSILEAKSQGKKIIGICGGFQILGMEISDPGGVQSHGGTFRGLGLLDVDFTYTGLKTTRQVEYITKVPQSAPEKWFRGYEIHYGYAQRTGEPPMNLTRNGDEGAVSSDSRIFGTNIHGILENTTFLGYLLHAEIHDDYSRSLERHIDRLATVIRDNVDIAAILRFIS